MKVAFFDILEGISTRIALEVSFNDLNLLIFFIARDYKFIKTMKENIFVEKQKNIQLYLESNQKHIFTIDFYSDEIIRHIKKDLSIK